MRRNRLLWGACGVAMVAAVASVIYRFDPSGSWFPGCLFHRVTGFHCPGCGMTRATHAALHGQIGEAFRFNPLGMILFPAAAVGIGLELLGWLRDKPLPFRFRIGGRWAWGIAGLVLAFWVLRNIPVWPCTLLAPP